MPPPAVADFMRTIGGVTAPATKVLVGISALVLIVETIIGKSLLNPSVEVLVRSGAIFTGVEFTEPWRLIASCFVHIGAIHFVMNMVALIDLGRIAEELFGSARLVIAYFVTGIAGYLVSKLWYEYAGMPYITAGASGAIFGINGVLVGELLRRGDERWKGMLVRTVAFSFVFYFVMHTNQAAHLGGLAAGFGLGFLFGRERRPQNRAPLMLGIAAVLLVLSIVSLVIPQLQYRSLGQVAEES